MGWGEGTGVKLKQTNMAKKIFKNEREGGRKTRGPRWWEDSDKNFRALSADIETKRNY
jgi:hypothetical protein